MTEPMSPSALPSIDIFCRVIDNYGDIGVCWRLAKQLTHMPKWGDIRLWVDDLQQFSRIEPDIAAGQSRQTRQGVDIVQWTTPALPLTPHDVVIEAFACHPPPEFVARMARQGSIWINLEYLSAEDWVEGCHALPSRQANGMLKTFFFPGFTAATGGLLREATLLDQRDSWLDVPGRRWQLLEALGISSSNVDCLRQGGRQVFLFCYPDAPAAGLIDSLMRDARPSVVIVPEKVYPSLKSRGNTQVRIQEIPFVDQATFDRLLWSSDLNFVRGEDSLVRAIWAGKPLIWQIYRQEDRVHLDKLQAWLNKSPLAPTVHELMRTWNTGQEQAFSAGLNRILDSGDWEQWQSQARQWTGKLAAQTDLAHSLLAFCAK